MPIRGGPSWQEYKRNIIRKIEQGEVSDEDFAVIKRLVETRDRDAAQVTVTQVSTVQLCSPIPKTPEPPSNAFDSENEGTMSQELEELTTSAGSGLETPGQQGPPNEGTLEQRQTTASGFLTAGVNSSQGGRTLLSPPEQSTRTRTLADIFSAAAIQENRRLKTFNELNKPFDPGGREEKAPPWNAAVPLPFFSCGEAGRLLVCLSVAKLGGFLYVFSCVLCCCFFPVFPNY